MTVIDVRELTTFAVVEVGSDQACIGLGALNFSLTFDIFTPASSTVPRLVQVQQQSQPAAVPKQQTMVGHRLPLYLRLLSLSIHPANTNI